MPPRIFVITGPTASGKTRLAVELAKARNGEVVSADSMQIYRRMDIGTAKPTPEEMGGIPHHMIDVADPEEDFSVSRYVSMAAACVEDILSRGKLPILAGGTGLYIDSLLSGRTFAAFDETSPLRALLEERYAREGGQALLDELARSDPETAARLHPNDAKRIVRALEVWLTTGKTITQHNRETMALPPRYSAHTLTLDFQRREDLWSRIDRRVDQMMAGGAPPCRPSAIRRWSRWSREAWRQPTPPPRLSCAPGSTPSGSAPGSGAIPRPKGSCGGLSRILMRSSRLRQHFWKKLVYDSGTQGRTSYSEPP